MSLEAFNEEHIRRLKRKRTKEDKALDETVALLIKHFGGYEMTPKLWPSSNTKKRSR